jgi:hypothetical protein
LMITTSVKRGDMLLLFLLLDSSVKWCLHFIVKNRKRIRQSGYFYQTIFITLLVSLIHHQQDCVQTNFSQTFCRHFKSYTDNWLCLVFYK